MTYLEIRELRKKLGLTQMLFAVKVGVTISTVQMWERNSSTPSPMAVSLLEKIKEESERNS